jgi:hypothetical protein
VVEEWAVASRRCPTPKRSARSITKLLGHCLRLLRNSTTSGPLGLQPPLEANLTWAATQPTKSSRLGIHNDFVAKDRFSHLYTPMRSRTTINSGLKKISLILLCLPILLVSAEPASVTFEQCTTSSTSDTSHRINISSVYVQIADYGNGTVIKYDVFGQSPIAIQGATPDLLGVPSFLIRDAPAKRLTRSHSLSNLRCTIFHNRGIGFSLLPEPQSTVRHSTDTR